MSFKTRMTEQELQDLKDGQAKMTNMLREFNRICRKHNLQYWCAAGTLIGVVRHAGWIPHDADIDVGMLDTDYAKLQQVVQDELPKGMWFQDRTTDPFYKRDIGKIRDLYSNYKDYTPQDWHNGLQIDIFVFKHEGDNLTIPIRVTSIRDVKYNLVFPPKDMMFEGIPVMVPNQCEVYCRQVWGDYPPPMLSDAEQYPHEGRLNPHSPAPFFRTKYPQLYNDENDSTDIAEAAADGQQQ